jgi:O-antigen/teichoic acid export membrane protein
MIGRLLTRALAIVRSPSGIYIVATMLGKAGGILLVPLYTRRLSPSEYGVYGLFISLLALLPTIFSLGLSAGLTKSFFDEKAEDDGSAAFGKVARGLLLVASGWMLAGLLVAVVFPPELLTPLSRRHVVFLVLGAWGTCATSAVEYYFRIRERALLAAAFPLVNFALTAGLGIWFVVGLGRGANGAVEGPAFSSIVVGGISALFLFARFKGKGIAAATRKALPYSLPFVPHLLAFWLISAGDRWVLGLLGSSSAVGTYYLATQLMSPVPLVLNSWNNGLTPAMGRLYRDEGLGAVKARLWHYEKRALLLAVGTVVAIGIGMPILRLLVGPRFYPALTYMPILALALIFDAPYFPDSTVTYYAGRSKAIVIITTSCTTASLAISAVLVPRFGIAGLLGARVFTAFVQMIAFARVARRVTLATSSDASQTAEDAARSAESQT